MYLISKRLLDIFVSICALSLFSPILIVLSVIIKMNSPGPILYRGKRAAKKEGIFYIFKLRTMVVDAEQKGGYSTASDDPRFTTIGRFLRKYKLDEVPQFINVLIGDMSLVGPRPQVTFYTNKYENDEKIILTVRPGITDLASLYFIDMDNTLGSGDVDRKYQTEIEPVKNLLRLKYVNEQSFMLDMRILLETAFSIVGIKNITRLNINP